MSRPCRCEPKDVCPSRGLARTYPGFVWSTLLEHIADEYFTSERESGENE